MMRWNLDPSRTLAGLVLCIALAPAILVAACAPAAQGESEAAATTQAAEPGPASVVYLVRHAEKAEENPDDPQLTSGGQARADLLVHLLTDVNLEAVWSTNTIRTRTTAAPVASAKGLEIELYNPRELGDFAKSLQARGGNHLVVGHSNTTPGFVEALGGDPISPIVDPEYDRFYVVTTGPDGHVETVLLRFGDPYLGGEGAAH